MRELLAHYRDVDEDLGEIMLLVGGEAMPADVREIFRDLGARLVLDGRIDAASAHAENLALVRVAPPE